MTHPFHASLLRVARSRASLCVSVVLLSGCANLAGVGGSADFGCQAPVGVQCESVAGNYYNALQQNLPSQKKAPRAAAADDAVPTRARNDALPRPTAVTLGLNAPEGNAPLRSAPRVLRLWIKSWEDSDGDLHSPSYVYVPIDAGRWLVEHRSLPAPHAYTPTRATGSERAPQVPLTPVPASTAPRRAAASPDMPARGGSFPPPVLAREGDRNGR